jgi:omega-6 fatty acid desaturase (delta-12 desaturase)
MSGCIASSLGAMTTHSHHTFNPSHVIGNNDWNYKDSGLKSTALMKIPRWLKYYACGQDFHHVHHMNAKIPLYNIQAYHEEVVSKSNMFDNVVKLSMADCYNNLWLVLYDEDKKRYINFVEADEEIRTKVE